MTAPLDDGMDDEWVALARRTIKETGLHGATASLAERLLSALSRRNVALAARDAEIARLRNPPCSVCTGAGTPLSGPPCICGGSGREVDEIVGLRLEVVRLREALVAVRASLAGEDGNGAVYMDEYECKSLAEDIDAALLDATAGPRTK